MASIGGIFLLLVSLFVAVLAVWAVVDALIRPPAAYPAAGKLTKPKWVAITAVAAVVAVGLLLTGGGVLSFFGLASAVAAIVYLVDVRPAVRQITRGGSSSAW